MPMAILVKPLSNPGADAWLSTLRTAAGLELLPTGAGVRGVVRRLRAGGSNRDDVACQSRWTSRRNLILHSSGRE